MRTGRDATPPAPLSASIPVAACSPNGGGARRAQRAQPSAPGDPAEGARGAALVGAPLVDGEEGGGHRGGACRHAQGERPGRAARGDPCRRRVLGRMQQVQRQRGSQGAGSVRACALTEPEDPPEAVEHGGDLAANLRGAQRKARKTQVSMRGPAARGCPSPRPVPLPSDSPLTLPSLSLITSNSPP